MKEGTVFTLLLVLFSITILITLTACTQEFTGYAIIPDEPVIIEETNIPPKVYFCPEDNCSSHLIQTLGEANDYVYCALFDLDIPELIDFFKDLNKRIDVKIVIDNNNKLEGDYDFIIYDDKSLLSHNKFCVIDGEIITTGSFNPTINGDTKNNNNFVIFYSEYLAKNYLDEFNELWDGIYGKGSPVIYPEIYFNGNLIENYFCPDDQCEEHVIDVLNAAEESIYFMTFSFTSDPIGDTIIEKHQEGIEVAGLFEKQQNSKYNEIHKMQEKEMNVTWDISNDRGKLHHKVFIIDKEIVITGSYNPTASGNKRNDENLVIIHDKDVADLFLNKFYTIFG
ncbi:MAG: phospholipase D-like domain-containing protein [Nanoarchaeota archaeon]|nr:phospholipase D-like domain-containing protein [Nanoarchaeota archaeon]